MRDRPLFIPGISGAGEKATQKAQSLKAGVLGQGKPSEISSYGLFCALSLVEVSFGLHFSSYLWYRSRPDKQTGEIAVLWDPAG